mmetsp:Transcript_38903/g.64584  ORF Transcript_38903/g.64584 Transcript_38903/m.64584 type:complete len:381 (+) Transcript_38903:16-1158(+)
MERPVPFFLYGVGGVGAELLRVILASRKFHSLRYGLHFSAVGVCDSSGAVVAQSPQDPELSDATIEALISHKANGLRLSDFNPADANVRAVRSEAEGFVQGMATRCATAHPGCILVDCTATESTTAALLLAVENPLLKAVSANKKPFAGPLEDFKRLTSVQMMPRVRYESTVVAGVPVIAGLQRVIASADPVSRIAGSFSGTLGFVMSELQKGAKFSEVVAQAKSLGYTEPDPRDDLGGVDVARKALILARTLGMDLEMSDVTIEPLYPSSFAGLSVPDFMSQLPELDVQFAKRVQDAEANGNVLRYAATVDMSGGGHLVVGLEEVPASSPLGTLLGTDNLVQISTKVYSASPLVLCGAGAGAGGTAAGVLADMLELAYT